MNLITRRTFLRMAGLGALSAAAAASMAGCASDAADDAEGEGNAPTQVVVTMTPGSEPAAGFDPLIGWGAGEHVHEPLIQSTLITTDNELNFTEDLAVEYGCSEDGMVWTFRIRDDARFTDGYPVTAQDVAFTVNSVVNGQAAEADLSSVREAVAVDDLTVELHMVRPDNAIIYTLAVLGIVPEHGYSADYGAHPVGSGRYMLEQWDPGQQVILKANPDYYGNKPLIDRVVVVFMEEDASLAAAAAGQADVAYTSATLADALPAGYGLLVCSSVDSRGISLPCNPAGSNPVVEQGDMAYASGNDVTCDEAVRRALNCGIDRDLLIGHVLGGYGSPAYSVGDGLPWASPAMEVATDREEAKRLLDRAGWIAGDDGIRSKGNTRCAFDLYYAADDSVRQAMAADFALQCAELGIEVTPRGAGWDDIYPHQYESPVLWGWGSNSPVELFELTYSDGWGNYAQYKNEEVDARLIAAQKASAPEEAYEQYRLAQWDPDTGQGVAPQGAATWVWLANVDHLYFVREGLMVTEQKPHPHGHGWSLVNNIDRWSWN